MKSLETGKDKIQKICDAIRQETLEPVRQEARELIENAKMQAAELISDAEKRAERLKKETDQEISEKLAQFQSSLNLASRQGIETLKQKIEKELFNKELTTIVTQEMARPDLIVRLIESFMRSLEEQGIEEDFEAIIPQSIPAREINSMLSQHILERLRGKTVKVEDFHGGVKLSMPDRQITIDISDEVVRELIAAYIRKDFKDLIFSV